MDLEFNKREDHNKLKLAEINRLLEEIKMGGGKKRLQKIREEGKMTARERINFLLDAGTDFLEIGAFAGHGMYEEHGGCPAGGTVAGLGYVSGKLCVVVANDASVKAGAYFPITAKKNLRAQEIAMENRIPIIYLVDSAGAYLPMQDEVFPDKEHFGRIFRNNAKMSAMGIVQISAIMGSCVAGGAYLPAMSDEAIIVENTGTIFLAGSYLVRAAIGEVIDNETLGGAKTHSEISGVTDYRAKDDADALNHIKKIIASLGDNKKAGFNRTQPEKPKRNPADIFGLMPISRAEQYDMHEILDCLLDGGKLEEYKADYGKSLICGFGRIDGWSIGIVANQRQIVKNGKGEMQFGGVIYSDSADKAARFISNCNQRKIPILFLQDVTGFMVGSKSEQGGIIKDGAKMVNAVSNSIVPKFTVIIGNSYGAGNYAMCGKAYDPRFIVAWPWSEIAVMGGSQAAKVLLQIQEAGLKKNGEELSENQREKLLREISDRYNKQIEPTYAAARLWTDAIINPEETRKWISLGIEAANNSEITDSFSLGVVQV
ncbi:acyl-CoA carboxylase subunit beta [Cruoricaptor ignavus]|uniref:acyl-CoA carboxylase subunit beta n=1 Tax=Cruoricaptor ignavus TaxID=1118202 RepID=UPI00370DCF49